VNVLSIQSRVVYGHVGNAAAGFVLERLGHEAWPLDTVTFSNHLGYETFRGRTHGPEELAPLVEGLALVGALGHCDAVLSGYLGQAGNAAVVLDAVQRVRAAKPGALYLCDPVMGDRSGGLYVKPGVVEAFATQLIPAADILTPNAFEAEHLTGGSTASLEGALDVADRLAAFGGGDPRKTVVVTSVLRDGVDPGRIETLARRGEEAWLVTTPRLEVPIYGAGDVFAALFLGHTLEGCALPEALVRAVSGLFAIFESSPRDQSGELALSAAGDGLRAPPRFRPEKIR
jgi:pyridoxine kinase